MGRNLALNMEEKGFTVVAYNRSTDKVDDALKESAGRMEGAYSLEEFCSKLASPRKIVLMVKAGGPVDMAIEALLPHLDQGDIIIDGGNSFFKDTIRRTKELEAKGFRFIGCGVSGGEEGARFGPAMMPGGQQSAYAEVEKIFTTISAQVEDEPCCTYIGSDGAGHYVKMVHNGIEYGDMQLICEAYFILKELLGLDEKELYQVFDGWNQGELDSYLIEITKNVFTKYDEQTGKPMVDIILDKAGQKGTGKWTSQEALDLGSPIPTIAEAVFARSMTSMKEERVAASKLLSGPTPSYTGNREELIEAVRQALYASKICSYAQGFSLLRTAAAEYGWELDYGKIAMIFRGGCIIRAQFLQKIKDAYDRDPAIANLLCDSYFGDVVQKYQENWRKVICLAAQNGLAVPAFMSALGYFDSYRTARLPHNLLQAQRDYFGAHTFERVDGPGAFHYNWIG
ncbi:decarboxylating NADP(+)-dependent phosphogluconate dehydrogenase [Oscillospiraceae bacterium MB08-C2-2]|nr:decarboxylating NADP(+)-dependent phosphogluconate dehydrogenase [Oscillospiraceae bacterium MB08-C2-2]